MIDEYGSIGNKFLEGGGEMSALIRKKDWNNSIVGSVENWPQSLLTTLNIILNSRFPMFLWWGPELTCFYNDAYRPSLGNNGKHPAILGMPAREAWSEIWDIIYPLIKQVLDGGEATWSEDQLIPIFRNGKIEDVYWTFSYSRVNDDAGNVGGVLVICSETTNMVLNKLKLQEHKDQLQFAIDAAEMATWEYNPQTNKFISNQRLKEWFGLPERAEEDLGLALLSISEKDRDRIAAAIRASLDYSSGGNYDEEFTIHHPTTQQETIVKAKGKALFDENNQPVRLTGTLTNVTNEVLAKRKITEAETRLRMAAEATGLATWELDLQADAIIYNPRLAEIFGHGKTTDIPYSVMRSQVYEEDLKNVVAVAFAEAKETGVYNYEARLLRPDKTTRWIRTQGRVFFDDKNIPCKLIGTIRDITEEKLHQQELQESEQKFRLLADSMPQHIWTADTNGKLNYFNRSVYDFSGLTPKQIQEGGWLQIVHPEDKDLNITKWVEAIEMGKDFILEHRFRRHDGQYRWQLSRAIPQKNASGKIQMWVGTSTDIEDQKLFTNELERQVYERTSELEHKNKELEKMNAELQSFAYVSSHDLQEPLRKIQTFANRILEREKESLSESGKDYFVRMQKAAKRMQTLIEDLLAYSRTSTSERKFEYVQLNGLMEQVLHELKEDIQSKKAVIEVEDLSSINVIPFQFRQLLHNLIGNSLKFSKPGEAPHITITHKIINGKTAKVENLSPQKKYYQLTITDNGIGFDEQYQDRIFEVFQRLHGKDEYKGTGIGLAIVKKIVENHEGAIKASAILNKGASFDIYLPL